MSAPPIAQADPEPFAMNLARADDFVAQYTFEWCVGASLQMAVNMAAARRPNSLVSPETLAQQFVLRDSTRVNLGVGPGYLLVLPHLPDGP